MRRRLVALAAVTAVVLAACGGAESPSESQDGLADPGGSAPAADGMSDDGMSDDETAEGSASQDGATGETADDDGDMMAGDAGSHEAQAAALSFTAPDLAGGEIVGSSLAGQDVVLWMWAPWCPTCNREAPTVHEVTLEYGDRPITFVGVPGKDTQDAMREFVTEHDLGHMLQAVDETGELWRMYGVGYQPAWVFINEDGEVTTHAGELAGDELRRRLDDLLDA